MKAIVVVDTNVPITANGRAEQASPACQLACITALRQIRAQRRIAVDRSGLILQEHRRHRSPGGQPGLGDAFFKWLWNNQANPQICVPVAITSTNDGRDFAEFPNDPDLASFDRSDRSRSSVRFARRNDPQRAPAGCRGPQAARRLKPRATVAKPACAGCTKRYRMMCSS